MRAKLWLMLAVAVVIAGGVGHEAFAGGDSRPQVAAEKHVAKKQTLTESQKAVRKKLLAEAEFLKKNKLNCGCQHHFPAPKSGG
jgi:hypothetical protein